MTEYYYKMKDKICISIDQESLSVIDENILKHRFRNRSHAVEYAIQTIIKVNKEIENGN